MTRTWNRLSALTAALSSLMYWPRSSAVRLKELKLDSSERSSRKRTTAAKHDTATCECTQGLSYPRSNPSTLSIFFSQARLPALISNSHVLLVYICNSPHSFLVKQRKSSNCTCLSSSGSVLLATVSPFWDLSSLLRSCTMSLLLKSALFRSDTSTPPRCTTWRKNTTWLPHF